MQGVRGPTAADVHHAAAAKLRVQPHVIISRRRWIGLYHPCRRIPHIVRQRLDTHVLDGADDSTADHVARSGGGWVVAEIVILLGLARRAASQIEKVSPFYMVWKASISTLPASSDSRCITIASSALFVNGFSQSTCSPARRALTVHSQ
eukprot:COSAG04_NODE_3174_length_3090_cov_1.916750_2_plen_149_part_00